MKSRGRHMTILDTSDLARSEKSLLHASGFDRAFYLFK